MDHEENKNQFPPPDESGVNRPDDRDDAPELNEQDESMSLPEYDLQADLQMEDLLDEAMGQIEVPANMADQIISQTMPQFEQQKLNTIRRIDLTYFRRIAAVIAIVGAGAIIWALTSVSDFKEPADQPGIAQTDPKMGGQNGVQMVDAETVAKKLAALDTRLAAVPALREEVRFDVDGVDDTSYDSYVDSQLDLIAMRLDTMQTEQKIADTDTTMELAVLDYQLQEMMDADSYYF
ncbi:hypothetical protein KS4_03510 [Poriferisphaera corsica]|uniref:Uncharacterized protein n=1 Tax=Poriferisphaera corsica TaxID=2528020 RepID=A0A517YQ16_9BACT|nr:hypothetical protein [Poriferisphaera corsica]QDU32319.1 hypothetical protein KS4_03510 [Poriferisphaera corsica]